MMPAQGKDVALSAISTSSHTSLHRCPGFASGGVRLSAGTPKSPQVTRFCTNSSSQWGNIQPQAKPSKAWTPGTAYTYRSLTGIDTARAITVARRVYKLAYHFLNTETGPCFGVFFESSGPFQHRTFRGL